MPRLTLSLVVHLLVALLFVPEFVLAQAVFIEGSAFAGIERRTTQSVDLTVTPRSEADTIPPMLDPNGTVAGGTFAIGTWLAPRVTLRLETAWPGSVEDRVEHTTQVPRPPVSGLGPLPSLTTTTERQIWERARTFTALVGYHTARRRGIQVGYLGGAAFVWRTLRQRESSSQPSVSGGGIIIVLPGGPVSTPITVTQIERTYDATIEGHDVGVAVGIDTDIAIGSHVSVVPQLRVIGIPNGGVSIRPGVGVRATW